MNRDRAKVSRTKQEKKFLSFWEVLYPQIKFEREQRLIPGRRFRFDFVHYPSQVAIEINGGNWVKGRHTNAKALVNEYAKINLAIYNGYVVFMLSPELIASNPMLNIVCQTIKAREKMFKQLKNQKDSESNREK